MTIVSRPEPALRRSRRTPAPARATDAPARDLYVEDFYSWTQVQAEKLRSGRVRFADLANIAEEIESSGRSEAAALESAYRLICLHLLKMIHQPGRMTRSWYMIVGRERINVARVLKTNPGLRPKRADLFAGAYADGRKEAALETGLRLADLPTESPFCLVDAEADDFWPLDVSMYRDKGLGRRRTSKPRASRP